MLAEQLCSIVQPIEFKSECSLKRQLRAGNLHECRRGTVVAQGHIGGQSVASVVGGRARSARAVRICRAAIAAAALPGKALSRVPRESGAGPPPRK